MSVKETFIDVENIGRGTACYGNAFGALVVFESAAWTSLRIAGVRLVRALSSRVRGEPTGAAFL